MTATASTQAAALATAPAASLAPVAGGPDTGGPVESHQDKITRTRQRDARLQRVRQIRALVDCVQKTDPSPNTGLMIRVDFNGMLIALNQYETQRLIDFKLATLITEHRADRGSPALPPELDAVIEMVAPLEQDPVDTPVNTPVDTPGPKKPKPKKTTP